MQVKLGGDDNDKPSRKCPDLHHYDGDVGRCVKHHCDRDETYSGAAHKCVKKALKSVDHASCPPHQRYDALLSLCVDLAVRPALS